MDIAYEDLKSPAEAPLVLHAASEQSSLPPPEFWNFRWVRSARFPEAWRAQENEMHFRIPLIAGLMGYAAAGFGQAPLTFDAASVKAAVPAGPGGRGFFAGAPR